MIRDRLVWRLTAPVYDRLASHLDGVRRRAIERLSLGAGDRVVVLGCGTGLDLEPLPADVSAVAVDRSPAMVRRTRSRAATGDPHADVRRADASSVSLSSGSADAVVLHFVLSVADDPDGIIREAARLLGPDGRLSLLAERTHADRPLDSRLAAAGLGWRTLARRDAYRHLLATPSAATTGPG